VVQGLAAPLQLRATIVHIRDSCEHRAELLIQQLTLLYCMVCVRISLHRRNVRKKLYQQADIRNYYNKLMRDHVDSASRSSKHNGSSSNSSSSSSKRKPHADSSSSSKHAVNNGNSDDVLNTSADGSSDVTQPENAKLHA
jgi:hypothetical protein